ncbi:MAG: hypothetical protein AAGA48_08525 [Myxococcota bacterium]
MTKPDDANEDESVTPPRALDEATEALRKAAAARGVAYEPPQPRAPVTVEGPADPVATAEAALAKAAEARAYASTSRGDAEREAKARTELERLKGSPACDSAEPDTEDTPPKRRL